LTSAVKVGASILTERFRPSSEKSTHDYAELTMRQGTRRGWIE
jgi:hypothetical protein